MRKTALLTILAATSFSALAESNYVTALRSPLIGTESGKLTYESIAVCQEAGSNVQTRIHAETPADGAIHRDVFLSLAVTFGNRTNDTLQTAFIEKQTVGMEPGNVPAITCTPLQATLGKPERSIELFMNKDGIKLQGRDEGSGETISQVLLWKDLYPQ